MHEHNQFSEVEGLGVPPVKTFDPLCASFKIAARQNTDCSHTTAIQYETARYLAHLSAQLFQVGLQDTNNVLVFRTPDQSTATRSFDGKCV